jgi:Phage tail tube protein, GTA-gp10
VVLTIDGTPRILCLTLGALARLESALAVRGLDALAARLAQLSARDLGVVIAALITDSGPRLSGEQVLDADLDPAIAARAVADCFAAAGGAM